MSTQRIAYGGRAPATDEIEITLFMIEAGVLSLRERSLSEALSEMVLDVLIAALTEAGHQVVLASHSSSKFPR
jgi:hypothetical protein